MLFHRIPEYSYLKTFGCLCFPYLRPYHTTKQSYRSIPCVFIGYNTKHKGNLCLHQPTGRIYISTHSHNSSLAASPDGASSPVDTPSPLPAPPPQQQGFLRPSDTSVHEMVTRARTGNLKQRSLVTSKNSAPPISDSENEPTTFAKASKNPAWCVAMKVELSALTGNNTWTLVPCPFSTNVIGNKWVYRIKRSGFTGLKEKQTVPLNCPRHVLLLMVSIKKKGWTSSTLSVRSSSQPPCMLCNTPKFT
ncbi:hypothetical protein V2J09_022899 [Rumex salicifolius]